jgi:hypothetical protein
MSIRIPTVLKNKYDTPKRAQRYPRALRPSQEEVILETGSSAHYQRKLILPALLASN